MDRRIRGCEHMRRCAFQPGCSQALQEAVRFPAAVHTFNRIDIRLLVLNRARGHPRDGETPGGFDSEYYRHHLATLSKRFVEEETGLTLSKRFLVLKRAVYRGGMLDSPNQALPFELPMELQVLTSRSAA